MKNNLYFLYVCIVIVSFLASNILQNTTASWTVGKVSSWSRSDSNVLKRSIISSTGPETKNFFMYSAALSSATQHAMPPEFDRMWGTECLNTRFPLPTLLCAGYSVKLILIIQENGKSVLNLLDTILIVSHFYLITIYITITENRNALNATGQRIIINHI